MSIKSLAFLSIRVVSICFFVLGVRYIGNIASITMPGFMDISDPGYAEVFIRFSIPAIVFFVFSVILWIFSIRISSYLVLRENNNNDSINLDIEKLEPIVYSILGVILLAISIPELIRYISQAMMIDKDIFMYQKHMWYSSIAVEVVKILLGIYLVLQANTIKKLIHRLRKIGVEK